jgi:D-beta-D-heptose 7-phosphate kinase/D-beta-D-heptose 1-phosphate adenosyltransferase
MRILVIGDSCIDIFKYGKVDRLAPEAPVPIIVPFRTSSNPGMAGNVVANLEALGAQTELITNKIEIRKIRYVDDKYNQIIIRVDENDTCKPAKDIEIELGAYDAIIISDYCKGFLDERIIKAISNTDECPVFLDTKKILGAWCKNIDFIKINHQEGLRNKRVLDSNTELKNKTIITRGRFGCDFREKNYPTVDVPVKDVSGAGDTFLAGLVVEYLKTNDIDKAINFAQQCTTKVVQKLGVTTI